MTLGPKFFFGSISYVYPTKIDLFQKVRKKNYQCIKPHTLAVSNHDLKPSGTNFACGLGFAAQGIIENSRPVGRRVGSGRDK